jgi:hypothetical protein
MNEILAWLCAAPFIALGAWCAWLKTKIKARRRRPVRLWEDDNQYDPER